MQRFKFQKRSSLTLQLHTSWIKSSSPPSLIMKIAISAPIKSQHTFPWTKFFEWVTSTHHNHDESNKSSYTNYNLSSFLKANFHSIKSYKQSTRIGSLNYLAKSNSIMNAYDLIAWNRHYIILIITDMNLFTCGWEKE